MIIDSLKLKDFGIFYGTQPLDFKPGLYVFHGHNGRGKTTLLNAVRWALYGHYSDRQGRPVPSEVTLNRAARREGRREFSVEMTLRENGDEYMLRRTQFISPAGPSASTLYMERNNQALTAGERDRAIQQLLSERISQFFLFDGEQLQRYEALLLHEESATQLIKQSIEQILGLPVLENAIQDLEAIRVEFNKRLARLARQNQQLEQMAARAEQAQADLESKDADIQGLHAQEEIQEGLIRTSDEFLQKYENSLDQLKNLEALDEKIGDLQTQRKSLRGYLAEQLREAWRDVLAIAVQPKVEDLRGTLEQRQRALAAQATREQLENSLASNRCVLCDQPLGLEHERHMAEELARQEKVEMPADATEPDDFARLPILASIVNTGHAEQAMNLDKEIAGLDSQELALKQESARLREALQNLPESDVTRAQKERDEAYQELGRVRSALELADADRAEIDERLRRAQDEIRKATPTSGEQAELARAIDLAESLRRVFEAAKSRFRDELRTAVEASASEVFVQLTNEPDFKRLEINDSYGLEIIDSRGEIVGGRSAGQEQVVALSLIAALNRNARRRAPVIMDTPFGRLDPDHRSNILQFISHMADQVFLLVHGGEVSDADLGAIAASINEQLELHRVDTDRTTIIPRSSR
jgi:DNA sulfur modification protein DndD